MGWGATAMVHMGQSSTLSSWLPSTSNTNKWTGEPLPWSARANLLLHLRGSPAPATPTSGVVQELSQTDSLDQRPSFVLVPLCCSALSDCTSTPRIHPIFSLITPILKQPKREETMAEEYVNFLSLHAVPKAMTPSRLPCWTPKITIRVEELQILIHTCWYLLERYSGNHLHMLSTVPAFHSFSNNSWCGTLPNVFLFFFKSK